MKNHRHKKSYKINIVKKDSNLWITNQTNPLTLKIQGHEEELVLNIVNMANHDIVLRIP